jgi:hypothetical protein
VFVVPQSPQTRQPSVQTDYVIVLDESSSMQWPFGGADVPTATTNPSRLDAVKQALTDFVMNQTTPNDRVALIGFRGSFGFVSPYPPNRAYTTAEVNNALNQLSRQYAPFTRADAAGKRVLTEAISTTSANGNTPTVQGLERARRLINSSAEDARVVEVSPGIFQTLPVRQVLVLLTDGVATTYRDGFAPRCPDGSMIAESCVSFLASLGQPIAQTVDQADAIKADNPKLELYVVTLGSLWDTASLNKIATAPTLPYFARANEASEVAPFMANIANQPAETSCIPFVEQAQPPIDPTRLRSDGVIGQLELRHGSGVAIGVYRIEARNGRAVYNFSDIQPGNYELTGEVYYRDPNSGILRLYNAIAVGATSSNSLPLQVQADGSVSASTITFVLADGLNVCAGR